MKTLAIIPARGGSKGLPGKNIKPLDNKPLIAWSIEAAQAAQGLDEIIVSTDSETIQSIAKSFGAKVPFLRPDHLASDTATSKDVLLHAIDFFAQQGQHFDYLVLLQPTSPFRKKGDIDKAIDLAISSEADMVVSVKETAANPYYVLCEENELGYLEKSKPSNFTRRQDCPPAYEYNGSIYVIKIEALLAQDTLAFEKTVKYLMDDLYSIDIDNKIDFAFAELLLEKNWL